MPHRDKNKIQLILIQFSTRTESQALNVTKGHKHSYQQATYISIPNDRDDPIWSMSQPGHNPHGYNPVTNKDAILLAIDLNTDTSNKLINVSSGHNPQAYNTVTN